MIFLYVGGIFLFVGLAFLIFPASRENLVYGYKTPLSRKSESHWKHAQKTSGQFFSIFGTSMLLVGYLLKQTGHTNFFIVEMLVLPWVIAPMFGCIEMKMRQFNEKFRGEENEHFND